MDYDLEVTSSFIWREELEVVVFVFTEYKDEYSSLKVRPSFTLADGPTWTAV